VVGEMGTLEAEVAFLDAAGKRVTVRPGYEHFRG
jgi:hypothetical protein